MAAEEAMRKKRRFGGGGDVATLTACKDLSGKHPVSALMELATKRRWGPPSFVQALEVGPSHKKQYIFKVSSCIRSKYTSKLYSILGHSQRCGRTTSRR